MSVERFRIFSLGDSAITIEFGNTISQVLNSRAISLAEYFNQNPFAGLIETVPAYGSTTVFFDVATVRRTFPEFTSAFDAVNAFAAAALEDLKEVPIGQAREIEIPVNFNADSAPDLSFVADACGVSTQEFITQFTAVTYRVFMLGFLPGFSYLGEVDDRLAVPRKTTPRMLVPKGSVGIAGKQTGIYSLDSPGGWQIIGRTDVEMFTPSAEAPSFLRPGDQVRFKAY